MNENELKMIHSIVNDTWQLIKKYSDITANDQNRWDELTKEVNKREQDLKEVPVPIAEFNQKILTQVCLLLGETGRRSNE